MKAAQVEPEGGPAGFERSAVHARPGDGWTEVGIRAQCVQDVIHFSELGF